jgi:integrase
VAKRRAKGEGSIYRENSGDWIAQITLPGGERKRKRSKSQQVVRDWLLEQRKAIQKNLIVRNERITVAEHLDRFMEVVAAHSLRPSTLRSYNYLIRDHIKPEIGHIRLIALGPDHLQTLYSKKIKAGLSNRTVQYIHAVIRRALNQAVKWGLIYRNPTDAVTAPKVQKKPPQTLSEDQVKEFLASVEEHSLYPLYELAITTGMRKGELLGLQWKDVDLKQGRINVTRTLVTIQGRTHLAEPKSERAKRTITLPEYAASALREHQLATDRDDGFVFTSSVGTPISQRNLTRHFHSALSKLGLPRLRFHDLRHTAATLLLKDNVHPKIVQEKLGHSTITLTLDTYSHVIPGVQDEAAKSMDKLFR